MDLSSLPPCLLSPLVNHLLHLDLSDSRLPANLLQPLLSSLPTSGLRSKLHICCFTVCFFGIASNQVPGSRWTRPEGGGKGLSGSWACVPGKVKISNNCVPGKVKISNICTLFYSFPNFTGSAWKRLDLGTNSWEPSFPAAWDAQGLNLNLIHIQSYPCFGTFHVDSSKIQKLFNYNFSNIQRSFTITSQIFKGSFTITSHIYVVSSKVAADWPVGSESLCRSRRPPSFGKWTFTSSLVMFHCSLCLNLNSLQWSAMFPLSKS